MADLFNSCFVCGKENNLQTTKKNQQLNLPVCDDCSGTDEEKKAVNELTEGMADGFVCGCI